MTKKEAIKILMDGELNPCVAEDREACDMAIKALEKEPCEDCISRQAVIDALRDAENHAFNTYYKGLVKAHKIIVGLPSVIPHYTEAEIQKMQEMEQAEIQKAYELGKAEQPKIGRWIEDAKTYYEELKKRGLVVDEYTPYFTDDNETQFFKHCPNCGAKM